MDGCSSDSQAIPIPAWTREAPELLLTDVDMPEISRLDLSKRSAAWRRGRIIYLYVCRDEPARMARGKAKPVGTHFIQKPFCLKELKELLATIFRQTIGRRGDQSISTRQKSIPAIRTMRDLPSKRQRNSAVSGTHSSSPSRKSDPPMRWSVLPSSMSWPFRT